MQNINKKALCLDAEWSEHPKCKSCALHTTVLISDLSDDVLNCLLQPVDNCRFSPRTHLYAQGNVGAYLFTIRSGIVKLEQSMSNGTIRIVRLLHAGDVVGLEALLGNSYHHNAIALNEVDACRIPIKSIQKLDMHNPELHAQLMLRWQENLDEADDFIVQLSTGASTARMARLLLKLAALGENGVFFVPSRDDIGAMLGVTTETASRMMAEFKRQGWVKEVHGQCISCDCVKLVQLAMDVN